MNFDDIKNNNKYFNNTSVIFDTNRFIGIKDCLKNYGVVIFNSKMNDEFLDTLNNKIINFIKNKNYTEMNVYNTDQKNRLKCSINKYSNLYEEIENNLKPILDILSIDFDKKINIIKINSDIALPGSINQYPHWDNEEKNKKIFLTIPLITMNESNGTLELWPCTNGIDNYIDKTKTENNIEYSLVNMQYKNTFTEISNILPSLKSHNGPFYKKQIIIRDSSTLHRGTINNSNELRVTLTIVLDI
jgi:hypothetical protein